VGLLICCPPQGGRKRIPQGPFFPPKGEIPGEEGLVCKTFGGEKKGGIIISRAREEKVEITQG